MSLSKRLASGLFICVIAFLASFSPAKAEVSGNGYQYAWTYDTSGLAADAVEIGPGSPRPSSTYQMLISMNSLYTLNYQTDGNLVVRYRTQAIWNSGTAFANPNINTYATVKIQHDGNFVEYDMNNRPIWRTATSGYNSSYWFYLLMQNDGNLVLYKGTVNGPVTALWSSKYG